MSPFAIAEESLNHSIPNVVTTSKGVRDPHSIFQLYQSLHYLDLVTSLRLSLTKHHRSLNASLATHRRSARRAPPRDYGSRGGAVCLRQRQRKTRVLRERIHRPLCHCRCGAMSLVADSAIVVGVPHLPGQQQLCVQIRQHDQDCRLRVQVSVSGVTNQSRPVLNNRLQLRQVIQEDRVDQLLLQPRHGKARQGRQ